MSFARDVKEELCRIGGKKLHCQKAELAAILDLAGSLEISSQGIACSLSTTQPGLARRVYRLINDELHLSAQLFARRGERLRKSSHSYMVSVRGGRQVEALYSLLQKGSLQEAMFAQSSLPLLKRECCKQAYLRGAFLAGGSLNDPAGGDYHLELVMESEMHAQELQDIMATLDMKAGRIQRKGSQVVYVKDRLVIADFLTHIGAMRNRLIYEDVLMNREMRNTANRGRNCELANVQRTVDAGLRQADAIAWLQARALWQRLSPSLHEVAKLRADEPGATLQELAEQLGISKSAANHRLRKLVQLAEREGWAPPSFH